MLDEKEIEKWISILAIIMIAFVVNNIIWGLIGKYVGEYYYLSQLPTLITLTFKKLFILITTPGTWFKAFAESSSLIFLRAFAVLTSPIDWLAGILLTAGLRSAEMRIEER